MTIGTVKEIKIGENRVGLTPSGVHALTQKKHTVLIQKDAGVGSGFSNDDYKKAGAEIVAQAGAVYKRSDMIVKVKEPQPSEYPYLRKNLVLFTYLHLAAEKRLTEVLLQKKVHAVAYETVELPDRSLPLLTPMSEVAGRMSIHIGAYFLQKPNGGKGQLITSVPGTLPAKVVILGTGVVSTNAAKVAIGMGADVTMLGRNLERLRELDDIFGATVKTRVSHQLIIEEEVSKADLVISGVYITGEKAPHLITKQMLKRMEPGTVIVDVAIDQGGSTDTSKPTTHENPIYEVDGIIHYCVTNMPGAVPRTSTIALTNATLPYVEIIAQNGLEDAAKQSLELMKGINTYNGKLTCKGVAKAFSMKYVSPTDLA
ncbi:MAG: Alanine dehydrogenase [Microgenomates group bacterium GW2011_GWC1_41_8]|uniref:Alanine dehydrogenase n=3 Tax=Candidatus Roizmaniibacteriota TaxID=1752723 RepID=A0A0G0WB33_9BACT|nr:MAG: Alanine dehydrogenase [Candidatus Roizmanbacteria bacterium GW2011_GWB1_40_7]KKS22285.1 MAG: Alanine dehydrogenase [Microgenomates group bacterium GW2011_GWC1_41_8]